MKVVILNKSDSTGGAAIVSFRLMEALRENGIDARMLVCEKFSDSPFVELADKKASIKRNFFIERLKIFLANGFNRQTLFKIDTGEIGLPLWKHQWVKDADAILINWVNQGMLSLKGFEKILKLGKPVIWTMHDMWCMTGICHHAAHCSHFLNDCGNCFLLGRNSSPDDLSNNIHRIKNKIYSSNHLMKRMAFVAVSNWLKEKAKESKLLKCQKVVVIPNAFPMNLSSSSHGNKNGKISILFGAARLDDPIKGLETLKETAEIISKNHPNIAKEIEVHTFGDIKDSTKLEGFKLPLINHGLIRGEKALKSIYSLSHIVVSASSYETLPGTLVEAQAYGCIPVSFNRGGQADIIDHLSTGYLAEYSENLNSRAENLAEGIIWAYSIIKKPDIFSEFKNKMKNEVSRRFSYQQVANRYQQLINNLNE